MEWDDKARAIAFLEDVCNELTGNYNDGVTKTSKSACRDSTGNLRYDFKITKFTSGPATLGRDDCIKNLSKEIYGCDHGGHSSYSDFEYVYAT